jgi:hypothetical protein
MLGSKLHTTYLHDFSVSPNPCPDDVPPALAAEHGSGPLALSALSLQHGEAHLAPALWRDP